MYLVAHTYNSFTKWAIMFRHTDGKMADMTFFPPLQFPCMDAACKCSCVHPVTVWVTVFRNCIRTAF